MAYATKEAPKRLRFKKKFPVQLGNVSIGDQTASIGAKIDRNDLGLDEIDELLNGKRATVRLVCGPGASADERQQKLMDDVDFTIDATIDCKSFSATPKRFSVTMCFNLEELKEVDLKPFAKKKAQLFIIKSMDLDDDTDTDEGDPDPAE